MGRTKARLSDSKVDELLSACQTGEQMIQRQWRHMKLQGFPAAGKSHFALQFWAHEAMKGKPEEALLTIIAFDCEGQGELVARDEIVPPELRGRIMRKVVRNVEEVDLYVQAFIRAHARHAQEYPDSTARAMLFENEGAFYLSVRDFYSLQVHGMSEGDLMMARQQEAISTDKKTLPTFKEGQMHAYKVINRKFSDPFQKCKVAGEAIGFHFMTTVLMKNQTKGYGTAQEELVVVADGRPSITDPLFDWILEFDQQQKRAGNDILTRHAVIVRKTRSCRPFRMVNPTQEEFWDKVSAPPAPPEKKPKQEKKAKAEEAPPANEEAEVKADA